MVQQHNGSKVHSRLGRGRTPNGWNEVYEPAILPGGGSADCPGLPPPTCKGAPAALGLGPALLGTRWAADVAERTEDTGPRHLYSPRRIYLSDRPGEPGPHWQNWRPPRIKGPIVAAHEIQFPMGLLIVLGNLLLISY